MTPSEPGISELYPIGTVARRTGVNPITLRAWERRYGLVKPHRTAAGHRLYGEQHIALIQEVLRLVEEGVPISRVRDALALQGMAPAPAGAVSGDVWREHCEKMIEAVGAFDEEGLEECYNEVLSLYPVDMVNRRLLLPLLRALGERWDRQESGVAEEHFFAAYMRNKLGARFHHRNRRSSGPLLVTACIEGERHEIGLLLFSLSAHDRGFRIVLLGADMPLAELAPVAARTRCDGLVLSGSVEPAPHVLAQALPALVSSVSVPVFIGGRTAGRCREALDRAGAIPLGEDLVLGLKTVRHTLEHKPTR